jgi:hypothetical protein
MTVPGHYRTRGTGVTFNGSTANTSDGSPLIDLFQGGKLFIPLLDKGGDQVGQIEASVSADPGSSNGTVNGGTLTLGLNDSLAGAGASLIVEAALNDLPADPGLNVTFEPAYEPLPEIILAFLRQNGLTPVGRPAALVHIDRHNLVNGRDIRTATLKFTALAPDGDLKYYVVRLRDDGKCELLKTVQTDSPDGKNVIIEASSPDGFSTFALVTASETPAATPAPSGGALFGVMAVLPMIVAGIMALGKRNRGKR